MTVKMICCFLAALFVHAGSAAILAEESRPAPETIVLPEETETGDDDKLVGADLLPLEKFDEYLCAEEPPYPWRIMGKPAEGISVLLRSWAESPVSGNLICGKGVEISDRSAEAGDDCGLAIDFVPPPSGPLQLSFDFFNENKTVPGKKIPEFTPESGISALMVDLGGQMKLRIRPNGEVETLCSTGKTSVIGKCQSNRWYHLSVLMRHGSDHARFSLTPHPGKKSGFRSLGTMAPFQELPLAAAIEYPSTIAYSLSGKPGDKGVWYIDNVCMAGNVAANRQRWWPFKPLPRAELAKSSKKVFTYNFPPFGASQGGDLDPGADFNFTAGWLNPSMPNMEADRAGAGCKLLYIPLPRPQIPEFDKWHALMKSMTDDVRLAKRQGNDGFLMDFNQKKSWDIWFNQRSFYTLEAAAREKDFVILPAVYARICKDKGNKVCEPEEYARHDFFKKLFAHPATFRTPEGKPVMSKWRTESIPVSWWKKVLNIWENDQTPAVLFAHFNSCNYINDFTPISYAMTDWGPREPYEDYKWFANTKNFSGIVGYPIVEQDVRTRGCDVFEAQNSSTFRMLWRQAIEGGANWAIIDTWNDFSEQAQMPSSAIGFTIYDLNAYYIQWFKTGKQPEIVRDVLYYFYRRQHTDAPQNHGGKWVFRNYWIEGEKNEIELLAFLKEPGTLSINVDGKVYRQQAPAGITSFKAPLPAGRRFVPSFSLERQGNEILSGKGRYTVFERVEYPNLLYHSGVITQ